MLASIDTAALRRHEIIALGLTDRQIRRAVREGALIRARRDRYLRGEAPGAVVEAVRVGGRLTCLSLLRLLGVFVLERPLLHVHVERGSSRHRSPHSRSRPLASLGGRVARLHWSPLVRPDQSDGGAVGIVDAVIHAVRCQPPRAAIATLDSALNKRFLTGEQLDEIFAALPRRFRVLRAHLDARAESGTETLVRLIARSMGCEVELQVLFAGVGRVDLLIDGWLIVECDSVAHHADRASYEKDRARDLALASRGYVTLRLAATTVLEQPDQVRSAIAALRAAYGRVG